MEAMLKAKLDYEERAESAGLDIEQTEGIQKRQVLA